MGGRHVVDRGGNPMSHFKTVCRDHGTIVGQCRCPGPKAELKCDCPPDRCVVDIRAKKA